MTDENTASPSDDAAKRKAALVAECAKRNIAVEAHFSEKRMQTLIANYDAAQNKAPAENPTPSPAATLTAEPAADQTEGFDENAGLRAELAELEAEELRAKIAAKRAAVAAANAPVVDVGAVRTNVAPANTLVLSSTHEALEAERNELLAQVNELGIAMALPKNPSNDAIRATIENHVANKAAAQAILDEQDRQAAIKGPAVMVKVRILPMGSGKLSRGVHIPSKGDSCFMYGEVAELELEVAKSNVALGYVEIVHG